MKKAILLFALIFIGLKLQAQHQFDYAYGFGDQGTVIEHIVDASDKNYLLITPSTTSTPLFVDPQNRQIVTTKESNKSFFFISVLNADGSYVRSIEFELELNLYFPDFRVNTQGEIYVFGTFQDEAYLDPQNSAVKTFDVAGQTGIFVAKYSNTGNLLYAKSALNSQGATFPDHVKLALINDDDFALYATLPGSTDMSFNGTAQNFGTNGVNNSYIGLYKTAGNFDLGYNLGGHTIIQSLEANSQGDVYAFGYISDGTIDLDRTTATQNVTKTDKARNYMVKFDNTLAYQDHVDFGQGSISGSRLLKIDDSDSVIIASTSAWEGIFTDNTRDRLDLDNGQETFEVVGETTRALFVGRYSSNFVFGGASVYGGTSNNEHLIEDIDVNANQFLLHYRTTGYTMNLGRMNGPELLVSANRHGMMSLGRDGCILGNEVIAFISNARLDSNGNIYYSGNASGQEDLNTGTATFSLSELDQNLLGIYTARMTSCQGESTTNIVNLCAGDTYQIGSNTYSEAGGYMDFLENTSGCDSLVVTTIKYSSSTVLTAQISIASAITCNGESGSINVMVSGGTAPYQYSLDGTTFNAIPGNGVVDGIEAVNGLMLTIMDAAGCTTATNQVTLTAPPALSFTSIDLSQLPCIGEANGVIVANATQGSGGRTFSIDGTNFQSNGVFSNLSAGSYTLTIKDQNGCTAEETVQLTAQPALTASISSTMASSCGASDGTITVDNVTNSQGAFTYNIDGGSFGNSNTFTNLTAGTYLIGIKEDGNCTTIFTVNVAENAAVTGSASFTDPTCFGGTNGTITVTASGGTAPYDFSLDGVSFQSTGTFTGLAEGTYSITIRDAGNCIHIRTVTLLAPTQLTSVVNVNNQVTCFGANDGSITVTASGGSPGYQYSLVGTNFTSTGTFDNLAAGIYTATAKDANDCTSMLSVTITEPLQIMLTATVDNDVTCHGGNDGTIVLAVTNGIGNVEYSIDGTNYQSSAAFDELAAGTYTLHARDGNSCVVSTSATITEPAAIASQITASNISCNGQTDGALTIVTTGGTGDYTYSIDGTNFGASASFTGLAAGNYTITVKDEADCSATFQATIIEPAALNLNFEKVDISCFGAGDGQVAGQTQGGTAPYQYSLDGTNFQSGPFSNLTAGNYTLTVKDANDCNTTATFTIIEPAVLAASVGNVMNANCNGETGSAELTVTGGSTPYQYSFDGSTFNNSVDLSALAAASYNITIRDANACETTVAFVITEPSAITGTASASSLNCNGDSNGEITVIAMGGTGTLEYSLDATNFQPGNQFTNLTAGSYTVTIRDANACTETLTVTITEPAAIVASTSVTNLSCFEDGNGQIDITATGGTGSLEYSIDGTNFQDSPNFGSLAAGSYTVTIRDGNQCTVTLNVTVTQPAEFTATAGEINPQCHGGTGSIEVKTDGGTGVKEFSIDGTNFQTGLVFDNLTAGTYEVIARDANGCMVTLNVTITEPTAITAAATVTDLTCNGDSSGSLKVDASGGTGTLEYSLDGQTFQSGETFNGLGAGAYTITIRDANQCSTTVNASIAEPTAITASLAVTDLTCFDFNIGSIEVTASGGTGTLFYSINGTNYTNTNTFSDLAAGDYTVHIRDENECEITLNTSITQPDELEIVSVNMQSESSIEVNVTGGVAPYAYALTGGPIERPDQSSNVFKLLPDGVYSIRVTDANGCVIFHNTTLIITATDDNFAATQISLYPNPVVDYLILSSLTPDDLVFISDVQGKRFQMTKEKTADGEYQVNVKTFKEGIFILTIHDRDGRLKSTKKFMKSSN